LEELEVEGAYISGNGCLAVLGKFGNDNILKVQSPDACKAALDRYMEEQRRKTLSPHPPELPKRKAKT